MTNRRATARSAGLALTAVLAAGGLSACALFNQTPSDPPRPPTLTNIEVVLVFSAQTAPKCTSTGTVWSAQPITVAPGNGTSTPKSHTDGVRETFAVSNECKFGHTFFGMQPGKWRISVAAGASSGVCESDFRPGSATVTFRNGSCSVFP